MPRKHVRRDADRTGEALADPVPQRALHLHGEFARDRHLSFGAHLAGGHFVDRADLLDRETGVDGGEDALVIFTVEAVISLDWDDVRTEAPRLAQDGAGLDAESLGGVAGGNCDGALGHRLHDDDGLAAQRGGFLLFARRKESVEVEEQPLHRIFGR